MKQVVLYTIFLFSGWLLGAQDLPGIIHFSKQHYQAHNQNWSIVQANDHTMFFANSLGLMAYDGTRWVHYELPEKQMARAVAADRHGRIFTGAYGEFGFWERSQRGDLVYHSLADSIRFDLAKKEEIWNIVVQDTLVFFQSFSTIYRYNYREVRVLTPPDNLMFIHAVGGRLFFQAINGGIYELEATGSFRLIPGSEFFEDKTISCILPVDGDGLLIGTEGHGIYRLQQGQFSVWNPVLQELFRKDQLNRGVRLSDGRYAFGTILSGLYLCAADGKVLFHLNQQNGLQNNTVLSVCEDDAGNLWLGLDKGIDLVTLPSPLTFFRDKSGMVGTLYDAVRWNGKLYIGTNQGVFFHSVFEDQPLRAANEGFRLLGGTQGQVWQLEVFDDQLLCGHNAGTFLLEGESVRKISSVNGGWKTIRHPNRPDILFQGTYTGVVVLKKTENGVWGFAHRVSGFSDPVKDILYDESGRLWLAHPHKGLYRMRLDSTLRNPEELQAFTEQDGLPTLHQIELQQWEDRVVVWSGQRYWYYDEEQSKFFLRESRGRPFEPAAPCKLKQISSREWFRVCPNQVTFLTERDSQDFLLSLVPGFEQVVALDSLRYLFCMDDGYVVFAPSGSGAGEEWQAPPPRLTSVEVLGPEKYHLPLQERTGDVTVLGPRENQLRFTFSQPVFTRRPLFSFRLDGFDRQWSEWEPRITREYLNLGPGHYTFRLRSELSPRQATFSFIIQPHWYQTGWAKAGYALLALVFLLLLYRWHHYRLEKQRWKMQAEQERRLKEQQTKAANERLHQDIINKSKELANSTMNLAQKNRILQQIKTELKQIRRDAGPGFPQKEYRHLLHTIDTNLTAEQDWQVFETNFNEVHEQFFKRLKADFPELTPGDLQLAAFLKMNLSTKEIAPLLNISIRGVENKRYRLRKKLALENDDNLVEFMMKY